MVLDKILEFFNKITPNSNIHLKSSKNSLKSNHFKIQIQYISLSVKVYDSYDYLIEAMFRSYIFQTNFLNNTF